MQIAGMKTHQGGFKGFLQRKRFLFPCQISGGFVKDWEEIPCMRLSTIGFVSGRPVRVEDCYCTSLCNQLDRLWQIYTQFMVCDLFVKYSNKLAYLWLPGDGETCWSICTLIRFDSGVMMMNGWICAHISGSNSSSRAICTAPKDRTWLEAGLDLLLKWQWLTWIYKCWSWKTKPPGMFCSHCTLIPFCVFPCPVHGHQHKTTKNCTSNDLSCKLQNMQDHYISFLLSSLWRIPVAVMQFQLEGIQSWEFCPAGPVSYSDTCRIQTIFVGQFLWIVRDCKQGSCFCLHGGVSSRCVRFEKHKCRERAWLKILCCVSMSNTNIPFADGCHGKHQTRAEDLPCSPLVHRTLFENMHQMGSGFCRKTSPDNNKQLFQKQILQLQLQVTAAWAIWHWMLASFVSLARKTDPN